jgi:hypothetical protein
LAERSEGLVYPLDDDRDELHTGLIPELNSPHFKFNNNNLEHVWRVIS